MTDEVTPTTDSNDNTTDVSAEVASDATKVDDQKTDVPTEDVSSAETSADTPAESETETPVKVSPKERQAELLAAVAAMDVSATRERTEAALTERRKAEERERKAKQEEKRDAQIEKIRKENPDKLDLLKPIYAKGLELLRNVSAMDTDQEAREQLATIRAAIESVSQQNGIFRVLLHDLFAAVNAASSWDELKLGLDRAVLGGNAVIGEQVDEFQKDKSKQTEAVDIFNEDGRHRYLVTYASLIGAVKEAKTRISNAQWSELKSLAALSKIDVNGFLNRSTTGVGHLLVRKHFPPSDRSPQGDTIEGVLKVQLSREGRSLLEVHGGKMRGYLIDLKTRESLGGKTFKGHLPGRLTDVLESTLKLAESSSDDSPNEASDETIAAEATAEPTRRPRIHTPDPKLGQDDEQRKGPRSGRADLGSVRAQARERTADGGAGDTGTDRSRPMFGRDIDPGIDERSFGDDDESLTTLSETHPELAALKARLETPAKVNVSPAAKELAEEKNVDLTNVTGTGRDGQITITNVRKAIKTA